MAGSASITAEDGKRVVKAHVKEKINEAIEDLRNLSVTEAARSIYSGAVKSADIGYAAATTTREGIKDFADAVQNRFKFEAGAALAGSSISLTTAVALGAVPHAAFKAASAAISVTYYMANGAKVSDAIRNIGGNGDKAPDKAASREIAEILREKSGQSGRSS